MIFLRSLGFVDVWQTATTLYKHRSLFAGEGGVKTLTLIWDQGDSSELLAKWKSLNNLISRASRVVEQAAPQWEIGDAYIEQLGPGAVLHWAKANEPRTSIHIGLVTTPMAMLYSGTESMSVATGQIVLVEEGTWHSAVNFDGISSRYHLVMTLRQKALPDEPG